MPLTIPEVHPLSKRRTRLIATVAMALLLLISTSVLAAPYGSRTMSPGTFGGDVVELQRRLADLGYAPGIADGIFGTKTRQALIQFQKEYGLVPDGQAGKWTIAAVDRAYTWKQGFFYTIQPGDSLWQIGQKLGTQVDQLIWLNRLQDTMLYPGQVLRIPGDVANRPTSPPTPMPTTTPPPPVPSGVEVPADRRYVVLGYYAEDWQGDWRSLYSLRSSVGKTSLVVNFQLLLGPDGTVSTRTYPDLMAEAARQGIPVQGLVHNFGPGGFDAGVARAVLSSPDIRAKAVDSLYAVAREQGLSGINVDIENVPPDQRPNYTAFVRELSAKLKPEGQVLTLSVPAKTYDDTRSAWSGAFDYRALGQYADFIVPMAYDETLPGFQAGPVASYNWVDRVAAFAASQIPKEKVLLGVAAYAYDWKKGTTEGRGLSVPQAMDLAIRYGALTQWDDTAQVPYFTYVDNGGERIVYFENARSTAAKLAIVKNRGLAGIAIWRMGLEDPAIWSAIEDGLR